jgi:hypothetical protein
MNDFKPKINPFLMTDKPKHFVTGRGLCAHIRAGFEGHELNPNVPKETAKCFQCKKSFEYNPTQKKFQEVQSN